ncbi:hypothetical protein MDA_GLEAN10001793 [Myotis davidii]|uniref:Uncharacterized protein n=1 Tax=Myotis davidii TaxID=225400 RepID=L5M313_MYODS|nr:hypothetical protein MDA_GLEAN10001793 [Myotis davidii]
MIAGWLLSDPGLMPQAEGLGLDLGTLSSPPLPLPSMSTGLFHPSPGRKPQAQALGLDLGTLSSPPLPLPSMSTGLFHPSPGRKPQAQALGLDLGTPSSLSLIAGWLHPSSPPKQQSLAGSAPVQT